MKFKLYLSLFTFFNFINLMTCNKIDYPGIDYKIKRFKPAKDCPIYKEYSEIIIIDKVINAGETLELKVNPIIDWINDNKYPKAITVTGSKCYTNQKKNEEKYQIFIKANIEIEKVTKVKLTIVYRENIKPYKPKAAFYNLIILPRRNKFSTCIAAKKEKLNKENQENAKLKTIKE